MPSNDMSTVTAMNDPEGANFNVRIAGVRVEPFHWSLSTMRTWNLGVRLVRCVNPLQRLSTTGLLISPHEVVDISFKR